MAPNMQKLDLFGVPLDTLEGSEETLKERNDKRRFVQDLLQVMDSLDTESDPDGVGLVQDFSKSKTFVHFDPYQDMESNLLESQYTALRFEDSAKLRASIVMNAYSTQITDIDFEKLTYEEKERYERVVNLLQYLKNVKIIDAPVLLKIYNLHRCSL